MKAKFDTPFVNYLNWDLEKITNFINFMPFVKTSINKYSDTKINKLLVLAIAKKNGINIPETYVVNSSTNEIKNNIQLISKGISEAGLYFKQNNFNVSYGKGIVLLNSSDLKDKKFAFSLFQEYVNKKIEIRTFYLKGKFKSMAIFSQQNEKTKFDFRNYDSERPNRLVPYLLPKILEKKLHKMMLELDINCGSIDLILTQENEYYFLEVNPIGQFQWLSKSCNFFIEKMIAKNLVE